MAHLLFVSVLNSTLHRRIFYQLAKSAKKLFDQVTVIGIGTNDKYEESIVDGIKTINLSPIPRISLKRLLRQWELVTLIKTLKPTHLCITSPELLPLAVTLKKSIGCKILYDVHENYRNNILYGSGDEQPLRSILANSLRNLELSTVNILNGVIYAETGYDNFLNVPDDKKIIVRNVYVPSGIINNDPIPDKPYLLLTGMWASEWGTAQAIELFQHLDPEIPLNLVIAGYSPNKSYVGKIIRLAENHPKIILEGGDNPLPYPRIEQLIRHCYAGIALYTPSPRMADRIPTKFYEYAHFGKPLFFTDFQVWNDFNARYAIGFPISYDELEQSSRILSDFYLQNPNPIQKTNLYLPCWGEEEKRWLSFLNECLSC